MIESAEAAPPVFADPSGHRRRRVRVLAVLLTAGALAFVGLFGAVLAGAPVTPGAPASQVGP